MEFSKTFKMCCMTKQQIEEGIAQLESVKSAGEGVVIDIEADEDDAAVRIHADAPDEDSAKELVKPVAKDIKNCFRDAIYSTDADEALEDVVVKQLLKKGLKIVTVESCTGGLLAGRLVNVSGVSDAFSQGFITYSNKAKRRTVNVDKAVLKKYGAVSKETAKEMAKGGILASDADVGVSVTGVAGPESSENKPVGLVYIGCYYKDKVTVRECRFDGDRQSVRRQAVTMALDMVRRRMIDE